jgi:hypothetical protein
MARRREVTFKSENRKSTFLGREKPNGRKLFVLLFVAIFLSLIGLEACWLGFIWAGHASAMKLAALALIGFAASAADIAIVVYIWRKYR